MGITEKMKDEGCYCQSCDALGKEIERLRAVLCKLVERDVTYWDSKGEVRHDVGTSQAEAMAIFREARALVTPNVKCAA